MLARCYYCSFNTELWGTSAKLCLAFLLTQQEIKYPDTLKLCKKENLFTAKSKTNLEAKTPTIMVKRCKDM